VSVTVRVAPAENRPWIAERAQINLHPLVMVIEAVNDAGRILAQVGLERHFPGACMMHVALDHPAALRHVLAPAFRLVFDAHPHGFGCVEAFAPVKDDNRASLLLVEHLGFRKLFHGKDWMAPGIGLVWFGMRRCDCRWLGKDGG
jgi:hypothetical protein